MRLIFHKKLQESGDIWTFIFLPQDQTHWIAGQSIRLEIPGPYGPLEHRFSISSAPLSGEIAIATRLSDSDYKESLSALQPGDVIQGYGIEGDVIWRESDAPHIFAAAGIGITPFRAMIADRHLQEKTIPATLLYSSRDDPMLYETELKARNAAHTDLTVHFLREHITAATILQQPYSKNAFIYISGPSKMVSALSADLLTAGIAPAHILQDHFTGRLNVGG